MENKIPDSVSKFSEQYDSLYDRVIEFINENSVCNIHEENGHITCNGEGCELKLWVPDKLCCNRCPTHYYKNGQCTVKSLGCKMFICQKAWRLLPWGVKRKFNKLRNEMKELLRPFGVRKYVYLAKEDFIAMMDNSLEKRQEAESKPE